MWICGHLGQRPSPHYEMPEERKDDAEMQEIIEGHWTEYLWDSARSVLHQPYET